MKFSATLIAAALSVANVVTASLTNGELQTLARGQKHNVITVNDANYDDILNGPRDYHLVVLMTSTSPKINCVLCNEFKPEYELVASSWVKDHPNGLSEAELAVEGDADALDVIAPKNVYFLYSEFMDSRKFFNLFSLNSIPKVFYFPPSTSTKPNAYQKEFVEYQFFAGSHRDLLINWMSQITGHKFQIHIPPDYTRMAINAFGTFAFALLAYTFSAQIHRVIISKVLWSAFSLVSILLLISGYMFNQIRGVPYVREHDNGKVEYFQQGQQAQYGVETQIMSFVYGCLSLFVVVLVKKTPEVKNAKVQFLTVVIFSAFIFIFYSILVSIFRVKSYGYPYKLLNIF
ncbi:dolichyl-diphosphooligosaccharide--protein glycosyltransferase subunit 3 [[Candida] anglica]